MGRFSVAVFPEEKMKFYGNLYGTKIKGFVFVPEFDTGGAPDFYIWIYKDGENIGKRRWDCSESQPDLTHVRSFCQKFAKDEEYRKQFIFTDEVTKKGEILQFPGIANIEEGETQGPR